MRHLEDGVSWIATGVGAGYQSRPWVSEVAGHLGGRASLGWMPSACLGRGSVPGMVPPRPDGKRAAGRPHTRTLERQPDGAWAVRAGVAPGRCWRWYAL